jgi:hypothetical protein
MKIPRKSKQWAKEAIKAMEIAEGMALKDMVTNEEEALTKMFLFAPYICAINRDINDQELISTMSEVVVGEKLEEFKKFPEALDNHDINFLLAYLDCHVYLKLINDFKHHKIMENIMTNYNI